EEACVYLGTVKFSSEIEAVIMEKYIVEVEGAKVAENGRPSMGPVYRTIHAKDGFPEPPPGVESCWDIFSLAVQKHPQNPMLGQREIINGKAGKYTWLTYQEVRNMVLKIGSAIRSCGLEQGDRCGIYGANCPEWIISMEACNGHGIYCVPLYDTLGAEAVEFIIRHAEVSIAIVQETKIPAILKCMYSHVPGTSRVWKSVPGMHPGPSSLTETCAGSFVSIPNVMSMLGTVGPPAPNIEACLESVPDMGYDALSQVPRGEVCVRGKTLFKGYYKRDDLTNEVMIDGWFHTGDVGEWQPDGALKIIDRKKNIFKLSQGEYIAVENLENVYGLCSAIDAVWIYGNSFESFLVAIVTPNQQALQNWATANGETGDFTALCQNPKAKAYILDELNAVAKSNKLKGFEFLKAIHLDPLPFDMERDLLTPTFKKKRPQLLKFYK
ncbi:hypothetical protein KI387_037610, partial [Taxus chinensis]